MEKHGDPKSKIGVARFMVALSEKVDNFLKRQAGKRSCCGKTSKKESRCCR